MIEESVERRHSSHKRKERGGSEDRFDGSEKRARVSDEGKEERKERKERRRFEDRVDDGAEEMNGVEAVERRERRRFEDGVKDAEAKDANESQKEGKRERRKFEDRVKKEDMDLDEDSKQRAIDEKIVKKEPKAESFDSHQNAASINEDGAINNVSFFNTLFIFTYICFFLSWFIFVL